jgi:hypothetical protein
MGQHLLAAKQRGTWARVQSVVYMHVQMCVWAGGWARGERDAPRVASEPVLSPAQQLLTCFQKGSDRLAIYLTADH